MDLNNADKQNVRANCVSQDIRPHFKTENSNSSVILIMIATGINNGINSENSNRVDPMSFIPFVYLTFVILMYI